MREYRIPADYLSRAFPCRDPAAEPRIKAAIGQLIDRYGLRNRRILSLGAQYAREERWMVEIGENDVSIVDIDEIGDIRPLLEVAPPGPLAYVIGDALKSLCRTVDVVYSSSLAPDEHRRDGIVRAAGTWPAGAAPFHPGIIDQARSLAPGGLLIVQSYSHSLDALAYPAYLPACVAQLAAAGLDLIEVHRFSRSVGVMLYVAGKPPFAPLGPALTTFHGRGAPEPIERIWPR